MPVAGGAVVIIVTCEQRTDEWRQARVGRLTGSRASDMLATLKSGKGEAAGRRNLRTQLVLERLTGRPQERGFVSPAMQHGTDTEAEARAAYEALTGSLVAETGFLQHDTLLAGCSLDGHVGEFEGVIEIKCPQSATHLETLKSGAVPADYMKQIIHALWLTGAEWCDWMSYDPAFPEPLRAKLIRVPRVQADIDAYKMVATLFLREVDEETETVRQMLERVA